MSRFAAMLGCLGALLLMMGVGVGVGPANAGQAHRHETHGGAHHATHHGAQGVTHHVAPGVRFHDPDCQDGSAGWHGFVSGGDDSAATFHVTAGAAAAGKKITVTATAHAGASFAGGARTRSFTHTFKRGPSDCGVRSRSVVHAWVRFTNPTSDHGASWTGYVNGRPDSAGDHVTFQVTSGTVAPGATVTITATAESGYTVPGGRTTMTFTHTFCQVPSSDTTVLHAWVRFTEATAEHGPSWTGYVNGQPDSAGDHVTFQVTSGAVAPGATVTITATADSGYTFPGGRTTMTFAHTFCQVPSSDTTVLHAWVRFTEATAEHGPSWTGYVNGQPDSAGDHVTFQVTSGTVAPGATVTITATAESGYTFPHGKTTMTFTHTFAQVSAGGGVTSLVATVVFTNGSHGHGAGWTGYVNGVRDTAGDHVTFQVTSGSVAPGATVVVTATAETGYTLQGGVQSLTFTHTFPTASAGHTSTVGTTHTVSTGTGAGVSAGTSAGTAAGVSAGTASSGGPTGVSAAESTVPTSINAGLAGEPGTSSMSQQLSRSLFAGGALLLLLSGWLMARGSRRGAHRA
ncbi:hypothetical protein JCM18899A_32810 [Nocardioides sp. AN3]